MALTAEILNKSYAGSELLTAACYVCWEKVTNRANFGDAKLTALRTIC